jgi:hypothetical protein
MLHLENVLKLVTSVKHILIVAYAIVAIKVLI